MKYKSPFADYFKEPETPKPPKPPKVKHERYRYELICDSISDKDVVDKLKSIPNKCDYIRSLIRQDIKKRD